MQALDSIGLFLVSLVVLLRTFLAPAELAQDDCLLVVLVDDELAFLFYDFGALLFWDGLLLGT